ncbi:hypothetical protein TRFO_32382 [Tritrichomonas foetus]|uniref:Uncharacterized protein n=1 Tax=Tritrichomonas foetus TaxID=1144522 RepID=A0A1J4JTL7_9EUKA|nr:hypothetical protein TRFO_32382 [Tritrichomonas foetus]|eukprot:OHT00862.1 hypothetical protein TRFO_32382 [Tritrichomonas foetus]
MTNPKSIYIRVNEIVGLSNNHEYSLWIGIIPIGVLKKDKCYTYQKKLRTKRIWELTLKDTEISRIEVVLKECEFLKSGKELARIQIPVSWFPFQTIVSTWFPMMQKNGEIYIYPQTGQQVMFFADVHFCAPLSPKYDAPNGSLLVVPSWNNPMTSPQGISDVHVPNNFSNNMHYPYHVQSNISNTYPNVPNTMNHSTINQYSLQPIPLNYPMNNTIQTNSLHPNYYYSTTPNHANYPNIAANQHTFQEVNDQYYPDNAYSQSYNYGNINGNMNEYAVPIVTSLPHPQPPTVPIYMNPPLAEPMPSPYPIPEIGPTVYANPYDIKDEAIEYI